jgi:hypothetical protein
MRRLERRAFLKWSAALSAALCLPRLTPPLRLASTLPLPGPHHFFPNPDALLTRGPRGFDALLIPAYVAAEWIQRGSLAQLTGPLHRAHDPEGVFTRPQHFAVQHAFNWDWPRLTLGLALQQRGQSPNAAHPGYLAQLADDFPRADASSTGILIEYDWVIPREATNAEVAHRHLAALAPANALVPSCAAPLMLWPAPLRAQAEVLWPLIHQRYSPSNTQRKS